MPFSSQYSYIPALLRHLLLFKTAIFLSVYFHSCLFYSNLKVHYFCTVQQQIYKLCFVMRADHITGTNYLFISFWAPSLICAIMDFIGYFSHTLSHISCGIWISKYFPHYFLISPWFVSAFISN